MNWAKGVENSTDRNFNMKGPLGRFSNRILLLLKMNLICGHQFLLVFDDANLKKLAGHPCIYQIVLSLVFNHKLYLQIPYLL